MERSTNNQMDSMLSPDDMMMPEESTTREKVKDAALFGAEFIPGVGEALAVKRTSDALDKGDYIGAGIEATAGLMGLIPGVGDLAGKGLRVATKNFRKADIDEANKLMKDDVAAETWKKENKLPESQRQKRIPEVQEAAQKLSEGKITSKEYRRTVTAYQPIKKITRDNFPDMPTKTEIVGALKATDPRKVETGIIGLNKTIPDGTRVGSRLDIPSYDNYDKWIVSLHDGTKRGGQAIGYGQSAVLKNVEFLSSAKGGLNIAKEKNKSTIARIHGDYFNAEPEEVYAATQKLIDDPEWTQVGMNPFRHSYFYDKATGMPVTRADEVLQVGPLVLAKGVKKPTVSELKELKIKTKDGKIRMFNEGGAVMQKQMELFDEGGLMQEGGTVDPVSGNDVPIGSTQEEVRDDIPAQLSEGEFVMPADVVRYHGLDKMMALRDEAKAGLQRMEDMGQMGNADEAVIPDGVPFSVNDLEMEDDDAPLEMQVGGFVQQPFGTVQAPATGFQTQQSAFANYVPQVAPLPTTTPVAYQAPVQQATPTMQPDALPTFEQSVVPTTVTYINDAGAEIQIPVDAQGNPLIPVPEGFRKKTDTPTDTTPAPAPAPAPEPAPAPQQQDDDDGPPTPAAPKTDQFGREEDSRITQVKQSEQFAEIAKDVDPRGFIEKIKDDFMGAVGASTTSQEYQKALDELAVGVANYTADPEEQNKLMAEIRGNLGQPTRTELGMDLAPVTTGTTADLLAKIEESRKTSPETTRVETAQVTADADTTVSEAAQVDYASLSDFQKDIVDSQTPTSYNEEVAKSLGIAYDAKSEGRSLTPVEQGMLKNSIATELMTAGKDTAAPTTDTKPSDAIPTITTRKTTVDAGPTGVQLGRGEDMPMSARIEKSKQSAQAKLDAAKKADRKQYSRDIRSDKYDDTFAQLDKARRDDNIQRNSKPNRVGVNLSEKVGKDKAAKIEDRQGTATNVDKDGQIYYDSSHDWSKPTQTNINRTTSSKGQAIAEDRDEGGTGKIVCTEMYRQTQLDDWAKAMKIWDVYQRKYLTPHHEVGYHWLFKPYVKGMQNSNILTQFGAFLARKRTLHLKHVLTKGIAKDDIVGNIWCKIIHPIVYVAGKIQSWKK